MRNRLAKYIEQLLIQHECVTIPSIGGFILEHSPAEWDATKNVAYAPGVAIRFNGALLHHDGLLIEHYALSLGISLRRAKLELEEDVRLLRQEILRTQSYRLEGIGTLALGASGQMLFSPAPSSYISQAYYGLSSVLTPQRGATATSHEDKGLQAKPSRDFLIRIPKRLMAYAGSAAVLVLVAMLPLSLWHSGEQPSYPASFVPSQPAVPSTAMTAPVSAPTPKPQEAPKAPVSEPIETKATSRWITPEPGCYYLIIGSERKRAIAESYFERFGKQFPDMQILEGEKVFRISAATFSTQADAYRLLNKLKASDVDAWVYAHK